MTNATETASPADRELHLTRIIDAPREKVFRAWTDAELLKQWFAPLVLVRLRWHAEHTPQDLILALVFLGLRHVIP